MNNKNFIWTLFWLCLAIVVILHSSDVFAVQARVIETYPISRIEYVQGETVYQQRQVCRQNTNTSQSISDLPNRVFGSTEGMIGTVVGIAIGNNIASGGAYEKGVAALVGNQIGNAMARQSPSQNCYTEEVPVTTQRQVQRVIGYRVTVDLNGNSYTVQREFEPQIGSYINVEVIGVR